MAHCYSCSHEFNDWTDDGDEIELCPKCGTSEIHFRALDKCFECEDLKRKAIQEENYNILPKTLKNPPEIGKLYNFEEMKPEWLTFLGHYMEEHVIPTETVVYEPMIAVPKTGRSFATEFVLTIDGNIYHFDELRIHVRNHSAMNWNQIRLYEYWCNHGSDGHINYGFEGFVFLDGEAYKKLFEEYKTDYRHSALVHWRLLDYITYKNK